MSTSQGLTTFFERIYKTVSNRSVLDFVSEVWVIQRVMERKGIDHERYRKIQNDIDYVFKLARRNVVLVRLSRPSVCWVIFSFSFLLSHPFFSAFRCAAACA